MAEKLFVHADLGDGSKVLAGQLLVDDARGRFKYARAYLDNPLAFALDPINLPLGPEVQENPRTRESPGVFGVLMDAGPDEWGRRQLSKTRRPPPVTPVEFLLAASGEGVGALHFTAEIRDSPKPTPERPFENLVHLQRIAEDIESGREVDRSLEPYFFHGSGLGGARPKTLIEHEGRNWIAKFGRPSDLVDMCRVEWASMRMAREAGIEVPDVALTETARGTVVLVERFDHTEGQQHHLVSVASLINKFDITQFDEAAMSYPGIYQLGNRLAAQTANLAEAVFRRMLFNIGIGNTDDHLRNHAFYKKASEAQYRLTPGYDIVPNTGLQGSHAIALGAFGNTPSRDNIAAAAHRMGLEQGEARRVATEVLAVCARWQEFMEEGAVMDSDIAILERCFAYQSVLQSYLESRPRRVS
ncbi:MAG: type II toxin-antitoxin system HipA family toxin [Pseudomonadales bacterium]|nr:type II toxin-antitoxin system HipA family toxin [Pseudomonadales bacterium]